MLLEIKNIIVHYEKSVAVHDLSIRVQKGAVVSIIGANGAGKSTVLRALSGLLPITSGEIWFTDRRIDGMETTRIVKLGLITVPAGRSLFPYLNVLTNLKLGASLIKDKEEIKRNLEQIYQLFPRLKERNNQKAGTLSGGEQQMLAIGVALMGNPKLLCMDEPSLGLAPIIIEQLGEIIRDINGRGVTVLLVEQNVHLALGVAQQVYALQTGRVVAAGDPDTIKSSEIARKVYLGG